MKPIILIYTNGYEGTWPAIEYGAWIASTMQTSLVLAGVMEPNDEDHPVEDIFSRAVTLFQENNLDYALELENGMAEDAIMRRADLQKSTEASAEPEKILTLGPFGTPQVRRMLVGNSFRRIMSVVSSPILFVPTARLPIKRMLFCLGGLGQTLSASHPGLRVAQMTQATVTLLSVIPPVDLDYPEARKIRDNWKNLADTDTLTGRSLRAGLEQVRAAGLDARIKMRHGNIVEQILAEVKDGNYELVCMGSQHSAQGLRQLYTPNVTADIAEVSQSPILTVRYLKPEN
ncbi:MAG TPA: universal stress protein [Anaerolineales bacterium]|jgi:nucleotide-binding universal stress UspA family protein